MNFRAKKLLPPNLLSRLHKREYITKKDRQKSKGIEPQLSWRSAYVRLSEDRYLTITLRPFTM